MYCLVKKYSTVGLLIEFGVRFIVGWLWHLCDESPREESF